ncbi:GNAT family N-acetyltransferase [Spirochaeta cellobiosiphila]|uniref:GNAT family N-acetyltransferase n=1 Tax=Spirochaeta cellobiosiphila TaxID=504483 RepID=UPI0003F8CDAB|nr:GNAT family N-acetyltransferase [Spirochaeta cellobiosiphila]
MIKIRPPKENEEIELAEIRARSMRESLESVGRFDETRVRKRFFDSYDKNETYVVEENADVIGFFSISENEHEYYLKHLYIDLNYQNKGFGTLILRHIINTFSEKEIKLNALKGSKSNCFYLKNNFVKIDEDEYDNYYIRKIDFV